MHQVIIIPGLGDESRLVQWETKGWGKYNLQPVIHLINWRQPGTFQNKFGQLLCLVDELSRAGNKISLVGCSAGGSAALDVFVERPKAVSAVINVCGRLKIGPLTGLRSFGVRTRTSQTFAESVRLFEDRERQLTMEQRQSIMTVRARWGDEVVPANTVEINGAFNITIPTFEHNLSIFMALTVFRSRLIDFIQKKW